MHKIRKSMDVGCVVCGVGPYQDCLPGSHIPDPDPVGQAEYELLRAINNLREVAPDHPLTRLFNAMRGDKD